VEQHGDELQTFSSNTEAFVWYLHEAKKG